MLFFFLEKNITKMFSQGGDTQLNSHLILFFVSSLQN